jgi:hypothetical protein
MSNPDVPYTRREVLHVIRCGKTYAECQGYETVNIFKKDSKWNITFLAYNVQHNTTHFALLLLGVYYAIILVHIMW